MPHFLLSAVTARIDKFGDSRHDEHVGILPSKRGFVSLSLTALADKGGVAHILRPRPVFRMKQASKQLPP